ncbi:Endonuclease/exonuclease/phosphatase [Ochromonadaceae sp. CCMP2298]|nr:Endonuclease/exonuclease/phosphatase [Ochromonadaceae sp. CCMP2298]
MFRYATTRTLQPMRVNIVALLLLQLYTSVRSYVPRNMRRALSDKPKSAPTLAGRYWVDQAGVQHENPPSPSGSLKVVSYNVLGPLHGEGSKHDYAPVSITKWTRRRDKLLDELRGLSADVLCLQEVSEKGLSETFIPGLQRVGLVCAGFAPTRSKERNVRGRFGHRNIGSAIFCNPDKVSVLSSKRVHLKDFAPLQNCRSHEYYVDMHSKWNSMVMMLVQMKGTNQTVVVGNTHLFWDPEREDIKTGQAFAVADALSRFCTELGFNKTDLPPLILCGDFNGLPYRSLHGGTSGGGGEGGGAGGSEHNTALFNLLTRGRLEPDHPEHPDRWHTRVPMRPTCPRLGPLLIDWRLENTFSPPFDAYSPLFTTKTDDFQGWIDHIWINSKVSVDMVMAPPIRRGDLTALAQNREFAPMPNANFASDHVPIGVMASLR